MTHENVKLLLRERWRNNKASERSILRDSGQPFTGLSANTRLERLCHAEKPDLAVDGSLRFRFQVLFPK